jgi:imidazolonepropionase-like amidohydrolase
VTAPFEADSGNLTIRCGILVDGISDQPNTFQTIEITDGRISSIGYSDEDVDLDLRTYTCMPGFIDTHTHIAEPISTVDLSIFYTITTRELQQESRVNAEITLAAGVTTVRNVGSYVGWSGRDLRDRINRGEVVGPRMQVAGYYLTIPAGGGDLVIPGYEENEIPARLRMGVSRGPEEFRRKAEGKPLPAERTF